MDALDGVAEMVDLTRMTITSELRAERRMSKMRGVIRVRRLMLLLLLRRLRIVP